MADSLILSFFKMTKGFDHKHFTWYKDKDSSDQLLKTEVRLEQTYLGIYMHIQICM